MILPIHHIHIPVDAHSLATRDHSINCQALCSGEIAPDKFEISDARWHSLRLTQSETKIRCAAHILIAGPDYSAMMGTLSEEDFERKDQYFVEWNLIFCGLLCASEDTRYD
jgi:hypothetical protein